MRFLFSTFVLTLVVSTSVGAQGQDAKIQDDSFISYRVLEGKVYQYDKRDPSSLQLLPGVMPSQLQRFKPGPLVVGPGGHLVIPRQTSNSALPSITFRPNYNQYTEPLASKPVNPIGGLPTYPGRR